MPIAEKGRELGLADHIVTGSPEPGTRRGRGREKGSLP